MKFRPMPNYNFDSRRSELSGGDHSRTPSRSPTPRRRSDDEDTMEARAAFRSREPSHDSGDSEAEDDDDDPDVVDAAEEEDLVELPPYLPSVYGCRNMDEFEVCSRPKSQFVEFTFWLPALKRGGQCYHSLAIRPICEKKWRFP
jgi:hypothetical protein